MGDNETIRVAEPASLGLHPGQMDRAREVLHEQVESGRSPGLVAVVMRRGQVALAETIGHRTPGGGPMGFDTVFSIASATKPFTATVVMSLVEEGRIGLMQRVADYLPEMPDGPRDKLLVHHLLTHTGGYDAVTWNGTAKDRLAHNGEEDAAYWGRDPLVNSYLGCIPGLEMKRPPGTAMLYANLGYEMLGEIIRRVTGDSVRTQMQRRIFDPLGMADTGMLTDDRDSRLADTTLMEKMTRMLMGVDADLAFSSDGASGGVVSTPLDYTTFGRMLLAGGTLDGVRVLSKASVTAMTTNQIPGVPDIMFGAREGSWGYGFSVLGHERWPYFGGGIVPRGTARHAGAGGIDHWFDFENDIAAACFELVTEMSEMLEPISAVGYRFQDVVTAAVVD